MSAVRSLVDEASDFLLSFDDADLEQRKELTDGIVGMADASARLCDAESFLHLCEQSNVVRIARFLELTRSEFLAASQDEEGPDPGWFAVLHLMGLNTLNSLPDDELARSSADYAARLYSVDYAHRALKDTNAPYP